MSWQPYNLYVLILTDREEQILGYIMVQSISIHATVQIISSVILLRAKSWRKYQWVSAHSWLKIREHFIICNLNQSRRRRFERVLYSVETLSVFKTRLGSSQAPMLPPAGVGRPNILLSPNKWKDKDCLPNLGFGSCPTKPRLWVSAGTAAA